MRNGLEYFSDRDLWIVCYFNFVLVWATFGTKFHRYRPAFITLVDGESNSIAHDRVCGWVVQAPLYPNREHAKGVKR